MHRILILLAAIFIAACGTSGPPPPLAPLRNATVTPLTSSTGVPTATTQPTVPDARCSPAGAAQLEAIRVGVEGEVPGNTVKSAWAVRSADYQRVWFVAALIYGPGIEDGAGPGVWAMGGEKDDPRMVYAVDAVANGFSDWGDGRTTDAEFSMTSDGAREARDCARR